MFFFPFRFSWDKDVALQISGLLGGKNPFLIVCASEKMGFRESQGHNSTQKFSLCTGGSTCGPMYDTAEMIPYTLAS